MHLLGRTSSTPRREDGRGQPSRATNLIFRAWIALGLGLFLLDALLVAGILHLVDTEIFVTAAATVGLLAFGGALILAAEGVLGWSY